VNELISFGILSIPLIIISRKSLLKPGSHGFYRFLAWEGILWLGISNVRFWFIDPFSLRQIISWIILFGSGYLVIDGVLTLKKHGRVKDVRTDKELYTFEKTTELVESGIYRYIRHPMYSSLFFLAWGIFLKHTGPELFSVSLFTSLFLIETALIDEKECIAYFGSVYKEYMKRTKRFIPFIF